MYILNFLFQILFLCDITISKVLFPNIWKTLMGDAFSVYRWFTVWRTSSKLRWKFRGFQFYEIFAHWEEYVLDPRPCWKGPMKWFLPVCCLSVHPWFFSRLDHNFFLILHMKLDYHYGSGVKEPGFSKKSVDPIFEVFKYFLRTGSQVSPGFAYEVRSL